MYDHICKYCLYFTGTAFIKNLIETIIHEHLTFKSPEKERLTYRFYGTLIDYGGRSKSEENYKII